MNNYDIKRLALVLAIQADIEAMKAENEIRRSRDESLAYNAGHFQEASYKLHKLA